jgi:hypothetical protein
MKKITISAVFFVATVAATAQTFNVNDLTSPTYRIGRIGIGASPTYYLDVNAASANDGIRYVNTHAQGSAYFILRNNNNSQEWRLCANGIDGIQGPGNFSIDDVANTSGNPRFMIKDTTGFVGVGASTINADLHVGDGGGSLHYGTHGVLFKFSAATGIDRTLMEIHDPTGANRIVFQSLADAAYLGSYDQKPFLLQSSGGTVSMGKGGTEITRVCVGSAEKMPDLNYATGYVGFNMMRNSGGTWDLSTDNARNGGSVIYSDVHGNLNFSTIENSGGSLKQVSNNDIKTKTHMRIRAYPGQVIIGEKTSQTHGNNPATKLMVDGNVVCKELFITAPGDWADYVFDKKYQLMPLDQVESYVNENHHLPNVPSASELEQKGVGMYEMSRIHMEKIEELTLYIIELKKEMEELKKQISKKN